MLAYLGHRTCRDDLAHKAPPAKGYLYSATLMHNFRMGFFKVRQKSARCGRTFWNCCFLMMARFLWTCAAPAAAASAVFQPVERPPLSAVPARGMWVRPPTTEARAEVLAVAGTGWGLLLPPPGSSPGPAARTRFWPEAAPRPPFCSGGPR